MKTLDQNSKVNLGQRQRGYSVLANRIPGGICSNINWSSVKSVQKYLQIQ